jgi:threonine aldolase
MPTINGVIDLRSDTLTLPTQPMLAAMTAAPLGDDVWNEDPTVHKLERLVANLTGKEAGLFVPSGTMSNLIATITHCQMSRLHGPSEIIVGDAAHIACYEAGNASTIGSVFARQLPTNQDGTIDLARIEAQIKESRTQDVHYPSTKMVALENTHNKRGGAVVPLEYCWKLRELIDKFNQQAGMPSSLKQIGGIALHLDGARVWNAAIALNKSVEDVCAPFTSVSLCLSKGLGAPVGSVLVGPAEFIAVAKRFRKTLGGGMRQAGLLAAAGIYAIENNFKRLQQDHDWAKNLGKKLQTEGKFEVLPVHSNIVIWKCPIPGRSAEFAAFCAKNFNVRLSGMGADLNRAVPHLGTNFAQDLDKVVEACIAAKKAMLSSSSKL